MDEKLHFGVRPKQKKMYPSKKSCSYQTSLSSVWDGSYSPSVELTELTDEFAPIFKKKLIQTKKFTKIFC